MTRPVSSILMDARDGSILFAENAGIVRRPASLTKMMTLFLTFDALDAGTLRLGDPVRISAYASRQQPSRVGLRPGATMTVDQAIRAVAVVSANDVAVALAETVGGTEDRFCRMMTAKARALGMKDTSFTNATGLPGANLTTAQDMARLPPRIAAVFWGNGSRAAAGAVASQPSFSWVPTVRIRYSRLVVLYRRKPM